MPEDKKQPQTPEEDSSAQDLLEQMKDLESKVKKAEREKELHLSGQIEQHNALLAGIKNISPTIEEAEKNLAYFEEAKGKGLLQGEDLAKFEELKKSLEALKKTREETNKKVAAIYGQPEVEGRIRTLAFQENEVFDIVAEGNRLFGEELPKVLLGILEDAGNYVQTIADARAKVEEANREVGKKIVALEEDVPQMKATFSKKNRNTARGLYDIFKSRSRDLVEFRKELAKGAEELGFLRGAEKRAVTEFINSKKMVDLAQAKKRTEEAMGNVDKVNNEWNERKKHLEVKFGAEVVGKMENYETKRRAFGQSVKQEIPDPRRSESGVDGIFTAARKAFKQYSEQKGQMDGRFKEQMGLLLQGLTVNGGQNVFYRLFEQ